MSDYLFQILMAVITAALGYIVWLLKEERNERKANTQGMKEILGYMIDRWHEEYMLQEYITTDQRNQFESVYKAYAANRGNGAREAKWHDIQKLHIDDTKSNVSPFLQFYLDQKKKMEA